MKILYLHPGKINFNAIFFTYFQNLFPGNPRQDKLNRSGKDFIIPDKKYI